MTPISITVTGADGRMGKMILEAAAAASDITVAAALVPSESASLGQPFPAQSSPTPMTPKKRFP